MMLNHLNPTSPLSEQKLSTYTPSGKKKKKNTLLKNFSLTFNRCIQFFRFCQPRISQIPNFSQIFSNLPSLTILDIGCCLGTDLRYLIEKGAKKENVLGVELERDFIDLGFEFFGDKEILGDNVFRQLNVLTGDLGERRFDRVNCGSVFHLLKKEDSVKLATTIFKALNSGGVLVGRTVGAKASGECFGFFCEVMVCVGEFPKPGTDLRYLFCADDFKKMLEEVGFGKIEVYSRENPLAPPVRGVQMDFFQFVARKE